MGIEGTELATPSGCEAGTAPALEENESEAGVGTMLGAEAMVSVTVTAIGVVAPAGVILTVPL
jgi:multidrug efflux pump subunit AcrA (membrane-fusion protein)